MAQILKIFHCMHLLRLIVLLEVIGVVRFLGLALLPNPLVIIGHSCPNFAPLILVPRFLVQNLGF